MQTVLITGASGGIGYELAHLFAKQGYHLVLVARSEDKLQQMKQEWTQAYGINVYVIPKDLSMSAASAEITEELKQQAIPVDILVNNAGFGSFGHFSEMDTQEILDMIQVNILSLTHLTKLLVPQMMERGSGKILNIASTAAFQPGPLMAVYYATKAYVLSLSQALANELKPSGITVTALCPGPTDTGFEKRAKLEQSKLFRGVNMDAKTVARIGFYGLMKNEPVIIPGIKNRILAFSTRFIPRTWITKIVRHLQETRK